MNNEPVALPCCGYHNADAIKWNPFNNAVQCHNCGQTYTHPAKHLSLQKVDGELVAVTYTDDEHRIIEVLWEKPPAKTLTDEEIRNIANEIDLESGVAQWKYDFARAILRKAQEK